MPITSQIRGTGGLDEFEVGNWREAGLLKPSAIKPVIATIEQALVHRQLGKLGGADQAQLHDFIAEIIG
jgi:mRNA interferase MazF